MIQHYRIEMDDGTSFEVASDARDIRRWESEHGDSYIRTQISMTQIAQLVYLALRRTGQINGRYPSYEDFDAHCVETKGIGAPAPLVADPTPPDRMDASSAS